MKSLSVDSVVFFCSTVNGLLFFIISVLKIKENKANIFISALLLITTIMVFDEFGRWTPDFFRQYPQYTMHLSLVWFLFLPTFYFLIRFQVSGKVIQAIDGIHLLPLLISIYLGDYFASPDLKVASLESNFNRPEAHHAKITFGIQIIFYIGAILQISKVKYKLPLKELIKSFSSWLKILLFIMVCYLFSIIVFIMCYEVFNIYLIKLDIWKTNMFLVIIYGWLFIYVLKPSILDYPLSSVRYLYHQFDLEKVSEELRRVISTILDKDLITRADLNTSLLANELGISGSRINKKVRDELKISTTQLINLLRIQSLEQKYLDPKYHKKYTIEGLAKIVGFRSKSSFYRSFKSYTGENPATYFKRISKTK